MFQRGVRGTAAVLRAMSLPLLLGLLLTALMPPTTAFAAGTDGSCRPDQLARATVRTSLTFRHHETDYSKVSSTLSVVVPADWEMAPALSLAADTEEYRSAMRCLLGGDGSNTWRYRTREWRATAPVVTSGGDGRLRVEHRAHTWADQLGGTSVGPWSVHTEADLWWVELNPSTALAQALWTEVSVDLGGLAPRRVSPVPAEVDKSKVLRWTESPGRRHPWPGLTFEAPLPQRWNAAADGAQGRMALLLEGLAWDVTVTGLLLVAARRLRQDTVSEQCRKAARGLRFGAWVTLLIALPHSLLKALYPPAQDLVDHPAVHHYVDRQVWLVLSLLGLALVISGRPRWSIMTGALAASVLSALPVLWPPWFGLPWRFHDRDYWPERTGSLWLAAAAAALAYVWLLAFAVVMQRIADTSWRRPGDHRIRLRGAGLVLAGVAVTAGGWSLTAAYRYWERISWLSSTEWAFPDASYDDGVTDELIDFVIWFGWHWATEVWSVSWVITSVALLFALRARAGGSSPFAPQPEDRMLVVLLFPVAVAPVYGWYAGIPTTLLSLLLNLGVAALLLRYGARHSLLARPVAPDARLNELLTYEDRPHFLRAARRHRELHAQLRRLEKGQHDEEVLNRTRIERLLDRLHRWRVSPSVVRPPGSPARVRLPHGVSPIDVVLCWGPHTTWWDNARETARTAGWFGLPATGVMFWAWSIKDGSWAIVLEQRTGLLGAVSHAGTWQITWMAGGFLLGALWRVLPGRYGPTKAFFVTLAFTAPIAVHLGLVALTGQGKGVADLGCALLLLVLTMTGIRIDIRSFSHERPYWRSPTDLLLSVYQMRHLSVQAAYVLAQIVVVLAIWQQVRSGADPSQLPSGKSP